ncbi:MAG: hypothetical protein GKR94_12530 [Gammaproteobacteria bacterium]|nr:hypothetical protein [Gammaproteobacteria bacterium]
MRMALVLAWFASVYLGALLVNTPAAWLHAHLPESWRTPLLTVSGLLRQGEGRLAYAGVGGSGIRIRWALAPWLLWKGCSAGTLRVANSPVDARMELCPFNESLHVAEARFTLEAAQVAGLLRLPASALRGQMVVHLAEFQLTPDAIHVDGRIEWAGAEIDFAVPTTLGRVTAQLRPAAGAVLVEARNSGEYDVGLELTVKVDSTGRYEVTGTLEPVRPGFTARLAALGSVRSDGKVEVRLQGQLVH